MALRVPFDSSREVSSGLALLFVVLLSAVVAWMAVGVSTEIVQRAEDTPYIFVDEGFTSGGTKVKTGR